MAHRDSSDTESNDSLWLTLFLIFCILFEASYRSHDNAEEDPYEDYGELLVPF